jgi:hypothetical protein
MEAVKVTESRLDRLIVPVLLFIGVVYAAYQIIQADWAELLIFSAGVALLFALALSKPLQRRLLRQSLNSRHITYIFLYWIYSALWLNLVRVLPTIEPIGKASTNFFALVIAILALLVMMFRALFMLTPLGYRIFITRIPIWEQLLVAVNEIVAAGLLAAYVGPAVFARIVQPGVFTTRINLPYMIGLVFVLSVYYIGIQLLWVQRYNDWFGKNQIWVRSARLFAPLTLIVISMVIAGRFVERTEPRTADLLGDSGFDLAVLSLGSVVWLMMGVVTILVYTSGRGLRQRFLPDNLLDRLPKRVGSFLRSISDTDMLLILAVFLTTIPAYLFLLGDSGGVIGQLRQQILQRGSALLETSEQALALLFATPFYFLAVLLLLLYAFVFSQPTLSAQDRDELVEDLPIGFLIVIIITLYLFAVPFSQVLTEGRLPQLPQDLGRILLFNIAIPLGLLYLHYFVLIRLPYSRGQRRWREGQNTHLTQEQEEIDRRIKNLNKELEALNRTWRDKRLHSDSANVGVRIETLYHYMHLNSLRDDLNMQRLQNVAQRQQLAEVSEAPVSIAVARLPVRVVSLGIPLLLAIQMYQWAVLNNGLREVINDPNLTVDQFFRIFLEQLNP